jgi:hypothetical protein
VQYNLAILSVLANRPRGHATLDEVRREVEIIIAPGEQAEQPERSSAIEDIDILQAGLVIADDNGLRITDAGRSLLRSLENSNATSPEACSTSQSPAQVDDRNRAEPPSDARYRKITIEPRPAPRDAPTFLHRSFGSKAQAPQQKSLQPASLLAFISTKRRLMSGLWRRHVSENIPGEKTDGLVGRIGSPAFALLSLLVVITCAGAAIALGQINSLKSDVALLRRELIPLRERLEKLEQQMKRDADQRQEAQNRSDAEKEKSGAGIPTDQTALSLSQEEVQLIRDYIKAAPSAGIAAPAIKVGDPVGAATIPLPSPLTEKVPKLAGARFTTRNGTIIISTKNSRRADIVLPPS